MERYEAYKDSGVEWIGEIPEGWGLRRAKTAFTLRRSKGNTELVQLAATQDRGMIPQSLLESVVQVSENADLTQFRTVHKNDFVISLRSFQGGFELSGFEGVCSPAYQVFFGDESIDSTYFKYLFKSDAFISKMNSLTIGIREGKNIQFQDFANSIMAFPPINEQRVIADYLDAKTAEIDALVADCEREVELLQEYRKAVISEAVTKGLDPNVPMKDSGIEWIGEIPANWDMMRLGKLCVKVFDGPFGSNLKSDDYVDEGIRVVRLENLKYLQFDATKESYVTPEKYETIRQHTVCPEDLIVATFVIDSVKACRLPKDIGFAVNKADCLGVRTGEAVEVDFLKYYLSSCQVYDYLVGLTHGSTRQRINTTQLKALLTILPPMHVQQKIVAYLDAKTAEIGALIDAKQQMADKLREYRRSLISEAVTGKFKVPGV